MLRLRSQQDELLDSLEVSGNVLSKTMNGLSMLNSLLGNKNSVIQAIKTIVRDGNGPITLIDLGCGGGDTLRAIAEVLRKRDIEAQLIGIDGNPDMLEYAKERSSGYPEISFQCSDILSSDFSLDSCDILVSTQFIYRFEDPQLVRFLRRNKDKVSQAIIFSDLQRHWLPYLAYYIISTLLPFTHILKNDGLVSIKRSYIRKELQDIYQAAAMQHVSLRWKWAFRYLTVIDCATPSTLGSI